jgi:hypothetical protein
LSSAATGSRIRLRILAHAAGDAFRSVVNELGHWGFAHARDVKSIDLDPSYLVWGFESALYWRAAGILARCRTVGSSADFTAD